MALVVALACAGTAAASDWVTNGTPPAKLAADAKGDTAVTWAGKTLVVPPIGQVYHAPLPGKDVSTPASAPGVPFVTAVRRAPGGFTLALQAWNVPGQTPALHLARWQGAPPQLTLTLSGSRLVGTAMFQGKPVTGYTATPDGKQTRIYVYIACFGCSANTSGWSPMLGVTPKADGSFRVLLRPSWTGSRYMAFLQGPNVGSTLAPDVEASTP